MTESAPGRSLLRTGGKVLVLGLLSALLPSPERGRLAWRHGVDAPRWSLAVGAAEFGVGLWLFLAGGLAFMRGATGIGSLLLLENWQPELRYTHFSGLGLLNWLAWLFLPFSWPFSYLWLMGLVRLVAFAAAREAVGELAFIAPFRLGQSIARRRRRGREEALRGPLRRDRVLREDSGDLVVISSRAKPGWDEAATIDIDGWYYGVAAVEERPDGEWTAYAYRLRERRPVEVIRRLIPYTPPGGRSARSTRPKGVTDPGGPRGPGVSSMDGLEK